MNQTTRVLIPASISEIADGPYIYAACQFCYSKLVSSLKAVYHCRKCGKRFQDEDVQYRYRLSMTVADGTCFTPVTTFGGMLNVFFGCSATEFNERYLKKLQQIAGYLESDIAKWAIGEALVGCHFYFGFKIDSKLYKSHQKYGLSLKDLTSHQSDKLHHFSKPNEPNLVALQMTTQNESHFPTPVSQHLSQFLNFCENLDVDFNFNERKWIQFLQRRVRAKCNVSASKISQCVSFAGGSGSQPTQSQLSRECDSPCSFLDQTSIAFSAEETFICSTPKIQHDVSCRTHAEAVLDGESTSRQFKHATSVSLFHEESNQIYPFSSFDDVEDVSPLNSELSKRPSSENNHAVGIQNQVGNLGSCGKLNFFESQEIPRTDKEMLSTNLFSHGEISCVVKDSEDSQFVSKLLFSNSDSESSKEEGETSSIKSASDLIDSPSPPLEIPLTDLLQDSLDLCAFSLKSRLSSPLETDKYYKPQRKHNAGEKLSLKAVKMSSCPDYENIQRHHDSKFLKPVYEIDRNDLLGIVTSDISKQRQIDSSSDSNSPFDIPESEDLELFFAAENISAYHHKHSKHIPDTSNSEQNRAIVRCSKKDSGISDNNKSVPNFNALRKSASIHSSTSTDIASDSCYDMPESEDLDLFLAAENSEKNYMPVSSKVNSNSESSVTRSEDKHFNVDCSKQPVLQIRDGNGVLKETSNNCLNTFSNQDTMRHRYGAYYIDKENCGDILRSHQNLSNREKLLKENAGSVFNSKNDDLCKKVLSILRKGSSVTRKSLSKQVIHDHGDSPVKHLVGRGTNDIAQINASMHCDDSMEDLFSSQSQSSDSFLPVAAFQNMSLADKKSIPLPASRSISSSNTNTERSYSYSGVHEICHNNGKDLSANVCNCKEVRFSNNLSSQNNSYDLFLASEDSSNFVGDSACVNNIPDGFHSSDDLFSISDLSGSKEELVNYVHIVNPDNESEETRKELSVSQCDVSCYNYNSFELF